MSDSLDNVTHLHKGRRAKPAEMPPRERLLQALEHAIPKKNNDDDMTPVHQVISGNGNIQIASGRAVSQTIYGNCNIQIFTASD